MWDGILRGEKGGKGWNKGVLWEFLGRIYNLGQKWRKWGVFGKVERFMGLIFRDRGRFGGLFLFGVLMVSFVALNKERACAIMGAFCDSRKDVFAWYFRRLKWCFAVGL